MLKNKINGKCTECGKEIKDAKDTKQVVYCCDCGKIMCIECSNKFDICNSCWLDSDYDD